MKPLPPQRELPITLAVMRHDGLLLSAYSPRRDYTGLAVVGLAFHYRGDAASEIAVVGCGVRVWIGEQVWWEGTIGVLPSFIDPPALDDIQRGNDIVLSRGRRAHRVATPAPIDARLLAKVTCAKGVPDLGRSALVCALLPG